MEALFPAFVALWVGAPPALIGAWIFDRWRSRRRNRAGGCAICRSPLAASEPWLIQGRFVCEGCAAHARRRMARQLGLLAACGGLAAALTLRSNEPWLMIAFPICTVLVLTAGALQMMKITNRRAQVRLAAGTLRLPE